MKVYLLFALLFLGNVLNAQDSLSKKKIDVSANLTSRHVWRGLLLSDAFNVQPNATLSVNGFSACVFGSYGVGKNYAEADIVLSWQHKNFTVGFNDYCVLTEPQASFKYFEYKKGTTPHLFDAYASYVLSDKIPLKLLTSVIVYGNDKASDGKNNYSSYIELSYPLKSFSLPISLIAGGTASKGLYANNAGLVNIGCSTSKTIKISDSYSIPCTFTLSTNPEKRYVYAVFCIKI